MCRRLVLGVLLALCAPALAEPKSTPVDIKPFRAELQVFVDAQNHVYVYKPFKRGTDTTPESPARIFFGKAGSPLYEQVVSQGQIPLPALHLSA